MRPFTFSAIHEALSADDVAAIARSDPAAPTEASEEDRIRFGRFAADNGLEYSSEAVDPPHDFPPFNLRFESTAIHYLRSPDGAFEIGTMRRWQARRGEEAGEGAAPLLWGFAGIRLARRLPNMRIHNRHRSMFQFYDMNLIGSRRLSLEGEFGRLFSVYCAPGYERDVLYFLTPDVMAVLIDRLGECNAEVIDDWFFAYAPRGISAIDPAGFEGLALLVQNLAAKAQGQSENYRDERTADHRANTVATRGARLSFRLRPVQIAGIAAMLAAIVAVLMIGNGPIT